MLGQAMLTDDVATQECLANVDMTNADVLLMRHEDPTIGSRLTKHHRAHSFVSRVLRPRLQDLGVRDRVVVKHPHPAITNRVERVVFEFLTADVLALPIEPPMPDQINACRATSGGKRVSDRG